MIFLITKLLNIKTYTVNANILGVASQLTLTNPFGVLSPIILPILSTTHFFEVIEAIQRNSAFATNDVQTLGCEQPIS